MQYRKWLIKQKQPPVYWLLGEKIEESAIDDIDKHILRVLNENARKPVIEIAEEVGISSSLTITKD